jgi:hypothetical protein
MARSAIRSAGGANQESPRCRYRSSQLNHTTFEVKMNGKFTISATNVLATAVSAVLIIGGAQAQESFAYPPAGRTEAQQRQDQYECHQWAVEQSHFDPVQYAAQTPQSSQPAPQTVDAQRQQAARAPGGGAVGGAVKGAVIAEAADEDSGDGARAGAALGLLRQRRAQGAAAAERAQAEQQAQQKAHQQQAQQAKDLQAKQQSYQRARSTCYRGRGYTVSDQG